MINFSILYLSNIEAYQEGFKLEIQYMGDAIINNSRCYD